MPISISGTVNDPDPPGCPETPADALGTARAAAAVRAAYYASQSSEYGHLDLTPIGDYFAREFLGDQVLHDVRVLGEALANAAMTAIGAGGLEHGVMVNSDDTGDRLHLVVSDFIGGLSPAAWAHDLGVLVGDELVGAVGFDDRATVARTFYEGGVAAAEEADPSFSPKLERWRRGARWKLVVVELGVEAAGIAYCQGVKEGVPNGVNGGDIGNRTPAEDEELLMMLPVDFAGIELDTHTTQTTTTAPTPTTSTTTPASSSSDVVGVCVRADSTTGHISLEWAFTATTTAPEPANWTVAWTAGTNTFYTSSRPGADRSFRATLPTVLFSIFAGRTWSVSIDGGTDTNGDRIESEQTFPTDGTWTGTTGVGQC